MFPLLVGLAPVFFIPFILSIVVLLFLSRKRRSCRYVVIDDERFVIPIFSLDIQSLTPSPSSPHISTSADLPPKANNADAKKEERLIEDKTFGLKNKNKSKKVRVGEKRKGGKGGGREGME